MRILENTISLMGLELIAIDELENVMCEDYDDYDYDCYNEFIKFNEEQDSEYSYTGDLDVYTFTEVSDKPGIKYCLRDKNVICHEDCYDDQSFCETVVFLGYPEEKIKYPNAYPIWC